MGDSEYMTKALKKINDYAKSGYVLGKNFIATFESSSVPVNSNMLISILKNFSYKILL